MQISNRRALLVLMLLLRPMSAQPYLPLFPSLPPISCQTGSVGSYKVIFSGDRNVRVQGLLPAPTCILHSPNLREKKSQMCCSYNHLISTQCVATSLKVKCSVSTGHEADTHWLTSVMRLSGAPPCPLSTGVRAFVTLQSQGDLLLWYPQQLFSFFLLLHKYFLLFGVPHIFSYDNNQTYYKWNSPKILNNFGQFYFLKSFPKSLLCVQLRSVISYSR